MSKTYEALPGVEWVNGTRVPEDREIKLTAKEAQFDIDQGRIRLKAESAPTPAPGVYAPEVTAPLEPQAPAPGSRGKR